MSRRSLPEARTEIDRLDEQIQGLINARARVAEEIREIKAHSGSVEVDHYRPAREAEVLRKAMARNAGPLSNEVIARLTREIMSACLALESPLSVAYLGPEGTYTQAAVYKHFGHGVEARAKSAIDEIFREVEAGSTLYGVVPVENSTEGVVNHTLDQLASTSLNICGEVWLPVHHHLLSKHTRLEDVKQLYAHAQSFAQCRRWLDNRLPGVQREVLSSNGAAAKWVSERGEGAAIAGQSAAELYGLHILASNIEDDPNNTTRFLVIGRKNPERTGADATSLVFSAQKDRPGALFSLLEPFAKAGLNLTRIESRPSRRAVWDYNFFIDLEGHQDEPAVKAVIEQIRENAGLFKILGSYPRAVL